MRLREALKDRLSSKERDLLRASFDVIGDIAIIEVPVELEHKAKLIASTLLGLLKNVNVVACKVGKHYGRYRRQRLRVIAGQNRLTTTHLESGCRFRLDVEKCYFSPRLSHERLRAALLVGDGEAVFVAGSGVGAFPIVIAKKSKAGRIVGLEFNPVAHKFAVENVGINSVDVRAIKGDVLRAREYVRGSFDRVFVPAPHQGIALLSGVLPLTKTRGAMCHVYDFAPQGAFHVSADRVRVACSEAGYSCSIRGVVKCGQHAPWVFRVCVDAHVRKRYS